MTSLRLKFVTFAGVYSSNLCCCFQTLCKENGVFCFHGFYAVCMWLIVCEARLHPYAHAAAAAALLCLPFVMRPSCLHQSLYLVA